MVCCSSCRVSCFLLRVVVVVVKIMNGHIDYMEKTRVENGGEGQTTRATKKNEIKIRKNGECIALRLCVVYAYKHITRKATSNARGLCACMYVHAFSYVLAMWQPSA